MTEFILGVEFAYIPNTWVEWKQHILHYKEKEIAKAMLDVL